MAKFNINISLTESRFGNNIKMSGPLAHLVERIHGMDEVTGSSPVWSTNLGKL